MNILKDTSHYLHTISWGASCRMKQKHISVNRFTHSLSAESIIICFRSVQNPLTGNRRSTASIEATLTVNHCTYFRTHIGTWPISLVFYLSFGVCRTSKTQKKKISLKRTTESLSCALLALESLSRSILQHWVITSQHLSRSEGSGWRPISSDAPNLQPPGLSEATDSLLQRLHWAVRQKENVAV